ETPDPDDDPTREWRTMHPAKKTRKAQAPQGPPSAARRQHFPSFLARPHFELSVGAVTRLFVGAPASKLRHVPEAGPLHVLVGDFDHEVRPQRLPRQVLSLAPAALASRNALPRSPGRCIRPALPWVFG